jgi:hypothetical protein
MWVAIAFLVPLRLGTIPSLLFTFHPVLPLWAKLRKEPTSCKCVASLSFFLSFAGLFPQESRERGLFKVVLSKYY